MQTVASFYPNCAISQTMQSQGRSVLQYNAKQDLILILKKIFLYSCNSDIFCDKTMAIPQMKFVSFWSLFSIIWLFIEIIIWQPCWILI